MASLYRPPSLSSETDFLLRSRRDQLFGLWVASKLGLTGAAAKAYARHIMLSDMEESGEERVLRQASTDLDMRIAPTGEDALRRELQRFEGLAREQMAMENQRSKS